MVHYTVDIKHGLVEYNHMEFQEPFEILESFHPVHVHIIKGSITYGKIKLVKEVNATAILTIACWHISNTRGY